MQGKRGRGKAVCCSSKEKVYILFGDGVKPDLFMRGKEKQEEGAYGLLKKEKREMPCRKTG